MSVVSQYKELGERKMRGKERERTLTLKVQVFIRLRAANGRLWIIGADQQPIAAAPTFISLPFISSILYPRDARLPANLVHGTYCISCHASE